MLSVEGFAARYCSKRTDIELIRIGADALPNNRLLDRLGGDHIYVPCFPDIAICNRRDQGQENENGRGR